MFKLKIYLIEFCYKKVYQANRGQKPYRQSRSQKASGYVYIEKEIVINDSVMIAY